jgi:hypothetical protein
MTRAAPSCTANITNAKCRCECKEIYAKCKQDLLRCNSSVQGGAVRLFGLRRNVIYALSDHGIFNKTAT